MVSDRFQLTGHCLDGKFRVDSVVAEDNSAIVYAGQHLNLDRAIAIKVLKTPGELNKGAVENFIANFTLEAKTFVQVIDFGVSRMPSGENQPYMVLGWLTGRSSSDRFKDAKKFLGALKSEIPSAVKSVALEPAAQAEDDGIYLDIEIDLPSPVSAGRVAAPAIKPGSRKSLLLWLGPAAAVFVFIGYLALTKPRIHQPQTQQVALDLVAKPRREETPAVQARVAADPVPAQDEQERSASVKELTPPQLSANESESTPPLATIQTNPPPMLDTQTQEDAAKESTPPNPQAKSNPAPAARLRKTRSKPKHVQQRVSTVRREPGLVSAPTLRPVSTEQRAPNRRARSSNKPLQQTNIELE